MALTNAQYESIIREYEEKQIKNRHILENRLSDIRNAYPEYADLEDASASLSLSFTRRLIDVDKGAKQALTDASQTLRLKKEAFLLEKGYPADYLKPVHDCPDSSHYNWGETKKISHRNFNLHFHG